MRVTTFRSAQTPPSREFVTWESLFFWVLFTFLFVLPLFFSFNTDELFEFNKMQLTYLAATFLSSIWVMDRLHNKKPFIVWHILFAPLLLFLFSQLLSTLFSIHPYTSLWGYYSRFHGGLFSWIAYSALFYTTATTIKTKHLPLLFLVLSASAFFVSLYGIFEHFGHSTSCLILSVTSGQQPVFDTTCWVQDVQNRVFATFGQPNWLAAYSVTLIPLMIWALIDDAIAPTHAKKAWFFTVSFLLFQVLIYTKSRSGMLGLIVAACVAGVLYFAHLFFNKKSKTTTSTKSQYLVLLLISMGTLALVSGTVFSPAISDLFAPKEEAAQVKQLTPTGTALETGGTDSGVIRQIVWKGAIDVWKRYPLLGSGLETFAYTYYLDRPLEHNMVSEWNFLYNKAHNELLNFLATSGIVGLSTYLFFIGSLPLFFFWLLYKSKTQPRFMLLLIAATSANAGLFVSNFFGFATVTVTVLLFLWYALCISTTDFESEKTVTIEHSEWQGMVAPVIAGLILIFGSTQVVFGWWADITYAKGKALIQNGYPEDGIPFIEQATRIAPKEGVYFDFLSKTYAERAVQATLFGTQEAREAAELSLIASDAALQLNPHHVSFFKSRVRVLSTLAYFEPTLLDEALKVVEEAKKLSPTDPQLWYTQGLISTALRRDQIALEAYQRAVEMKPNYEDARWQLGIAYEKEGKTKEALEQFRYIIEYIAPLNDKAQEKVASLSAQLSSK